MMRERGSYNWNFLAGNLLAVLLFIFIASLILGFVLGIWESGPIQRVFAPESYWARKVNDLESRVKFAQGMIEDAIIELKKKEVISQLEIEQSIRLSRTLDLDPAEAGETKKREIQVQMQQLKDEIKMYQKELGEARRLLDQARRELSKFR
jgi:hypothetical protein